MAKALLLITGGNNGLGYYAVQQLAATGKYHILMGSRNVTKAETAIKKLGEDSSVKVDTNDIEPIQIDVDSDESINAAVKTVSTKYGHLDILMANAGIARVPQAEGTTGSISLRDTYQSIYNTNLFGAVVAIDAFLPLLRKSTHPDGKRIAFTSSGLASLKWGAGDGQYSAKNYIIYRSTKTAMSMVMLHYAQTLEDEGFVVSASDPGYCATDLNDNQGFKDPRDGAKELIKAAVEPKEKVHAVTVGDYGIMPW